MYRCLERLLVLAFSSVVVTSPVACRREGGSRVDEESQLTMYDAALRQFRSTDPRRVGLSDTLLFDSLKTPKRLPPTIPRELARRGVIDSSCLGSSSPECVTVKVSIPIFTDGDSAQVYVAAANTKGHEYTSRTYRFTRDARGWRLVP